MLSDKPSSMMVLSSYEPSNLKHRTSNRMRAASELEDLGIIDHNEKGYIKELITSGDERLQEALDKFEEGDTCELEQLVSNGLLSKKTSLDLLEDLDFHFLQQTGLEQLEGQETEPPVQASQPIVHSTPASLPAVTSSSMSIPSANWRRGNDLSLDDIAFDEFDDDTERRERSNSVSSVNSMSGFGVNGSNISPSMLGQNFPDVFDDLNENRLSSGSNGGGQRPNTRPSSRRNVLTISTSSLTCTPSASTAIDIPRKNRGNQIAALVDAGMVADRMSEFGGLDTLQGDVEGPHYVGAYSPESRRRRVARFLEKRGRRIWTKKVKYDVRKNFADSRMRVKGRFVRKEDEELLRDLLSLT